MPYLLEALFLLFDGGAFPQEIVDLPLPGWQRGLFVFPVFLAIQQRALFEFKGVPLLLELALEVIFFLLECIAALPRLSQLGFTLTRLLEFCISSGDAGGILQNRVTALDLVVDVALALLSTLLFDFEAVLGCSNRVLQGVESLLQRAILLCPSADDTLLSL